MRIYLLLTGELDHDGDRRRITAERQKAARSCESAWNLWKLLSRTLRISLIYLLDFRKPALRVELPK